MSSDRDNTQSLNTTDFHVTYQHWRNAAEYIRTHGGPSKLWASECRSDVLWLAELHPFALDWDAGGPPHLLIATHDGTFVAVTGVAVGYNGTGPGYAERLLVELGLEEDLAARVADAKVTVLDLAEPQHALHAESVPYVFLPLPQPYETGGNTVLRVHLNEENINNAADPQCSSTLRNWVALLDSPDSPYWLSGTRTIELYTTFEAAEERGLIVPERREPLGRVYPLRVIQGQVQTWFTWSLYPSYVLDRGEAGKIPDVARQVLLLFGVDQEQVSRLDGLEGALDSLVHKVAGVKRKDSYRFTVSR